MTDIAVLNQAEEIALADCEERIERGLKTYVEVGMALGAIRENRLYRADHETFEAYCAARWNFTGRRGRQLIEAAEIGNMFPVENSRQAAELAKVPEADRADVLAAATEQANGKPTAAAIREAHAKRTAETPGPTDAALSPPADPGATPSPAVAESPAPQEPDPIPEHDAAEAWKGDEPGSCGAACLCGFEVDGFDTLTEAAEELARHIETPEPAAEPPTSRLALTPEQREQMVADAQRGQAINNARKKADRLVAELSGVITEIELGIAYGEPGLITAEMVAGLRAEVDRLESYMEAQA